MELCLQSSEFLQQPIAVLTKAIHLGFSPISGPDGKGRRGILSAMSRQ
jgi:hypothetical protein